MSLATPSKIRELQIKLYRKAKDEPEFRFYQLYDKVYREDILQHAYALVRANQGAPGVDGESFEDIETAGLAEWINGLREELRSKTYQPQPVRRVMIPKPGGGERPLGIPDDPGPGGADRCEIDLGTHMGSGTGAEYLRVSAAEECAGCDPEGG
jgi:RNA-directed DNA polymerase